MFASIPCTNWSLFLHCQCGVGWGGVGPTLAAAIDAGGQAASPGAAGWSLPRSRHASRS